MASQQRFRRDQDRLVTAAERAKAQGWDVNCTQERNPAGVVIHREIRRWNVRALNEAAKERSRRTAAEPPASPPAPDDRAG